MFKALTILIFLLLSTMSTFSTQIKLTTWNIYMLPNYIGVSCDKRAELIADYLLDNNSDIFVFQEAFDANARAIIYSKLQSTYPY